MTRSNQSIRRHKTAIVRRECSAPIRSALNDGLIGTAVTVLECGCGRGADAGHPATDGIT